MNLLVDTLSEKHEGALSLPAELNCVKYAVEGKCFVLTMCIDEVWPFSKSYVQKFLMS